LDTQLQEVAEGRPNAIGVLRGEGGGLNLLFTGHMDTTWHGDETFLTSDGHKARAHHRDGWVWGLGANNMKSGLASALVAIEAMAKERIRLKGDVLFGAVVGEIEKAAVEEFKGLWLDSYGAGTRYMVTHGVTADFAILGEPTGLRVCTVNMGAIWAKIAVGGTLSHSARARSGDVINAIEEMHDLHTNLRQWIADYEAGHEYRGEHPNVTIAAIRGGMPWRAAPGPTLDFYVTSPPTELSDDTLINRVIRGAHKDVTGQEPGSFFRRTGSDASHMNAYGVPCIIYGPGGRNHPDLKSMDVAGEHCSVDNLVTAAKVYLDTALTICSQAAQRR
jgi:acetylornithine deacetylase